MNGENWGRKLRIGCEICVPQKSRLRVNCRSAKADQEKALGKPSKIDAKMTASSRFMGFMAVVGLAGCSGHPAAPEPAARQAIEAAVTRYVNASNRGDADALMELYAEDAVLLPPDHEPIEEREAIGEFWRRGTDQGLEVSTLRVDTDGQLGYLVGRYRLPATEEEPADSGKYVMCLKRQADGSWKLTADIWNSSGEEADGDAPDVMGPRSVSRAPAPRSGAPIRASTPSAAGRGGPPSSEPPV